METLLRAGLSNALTASVLALLVACLSRPLARRPAIVHGLWLLVLVKLVTPPLYEVPIPWPIPESPAGDRVSRRAVLGIESVAEPSPPRPDVTVDLAEPQRPDAPGPADGGGGDLQIAMIAEDPGPVPRSDSAPSDWLRGVGLVWAGGTIALLVVTIRRIRRFHRLLRSASPPSFEEQEWFEALASLLQLRRVPEVGWVRARISPLIWSLGRRPRLIIPSELWKALDQRQRSTLAAHELAHLKRGDHLVRFLEVLVTALYWWHPLIWWIRQCLRDAEELCCDAWVVWAFPDAARSYAETLLDTLDFVQRTSHPEPLLASGLGKVPHLRRRLTMIMTGTTVRMRGVRGTLGLAALAGVLLPVGATWAQKSEDSKEVRIVVKPDEGRAGTAGEVNVRGELRFVADADPVQPNVVVVQADRPDEPGKKVVMTGSLDEIIKKLEEQIAELKKAAAPKDAASLPLRSLLLAVDELKKARTSTTAVARPIEATVELQDLRPAQIVTVDVRGKDGPGDRNSAELIKARQEVSDLRAALEAKLKELQAAQERVRKLGGDPGDVPLLGWHRSAPSSRVMYRTYTVTRPVQVTRIQKEAVTRPAIKSEVRIETVEEPRPAEKPRTSAAEKERAPRAKQLVEKAITAYRDGRFVESEALAGKAIAIDPNQAAASTIRFKARMERQSQASGEEGKRASGATSEQSRIEDLEKKLDSLQKEVDRLKKGTQPETSLKK